MAEVKRWEKEKAGKPYTPTKQESAPNTNINWKSPTFWPLIDQVARGQIGKPNLSKMVEELMSQDFHFTHFNRQDLSKWRDQSIKNKLVWSEQTLAEVRKEFLPGGVDTHFDVFVSIFQLLDVSY